MATAAERKAAKEKARVHRVEKVTGPLEQSRKRFEAKYGDTDGVREVGISALDHGIWSIIVYVDDVDAVNLPETYEEWPVEVQMYC